MSELVKTARKRFAEAVDAESDNRDVAIEALNFRHGDQWPEDIKASREREGRPCLTLNRIPQYVRNVINDIRMVRPAIKVRPVDSQSDPETANILNGMIRQIEKSCNAESAYDWAAEYAITGGWGYFRITTEYEDEYSFNQCIKIERIANPFSVYMDPNRSEPDGSDAKWCFVIDTMSREQFEAKYPDANSEWSEQIGNGMSKDDWFSKDSVRVAEYWVKEEEEYTISLVTDPISGQEYITEGEVDGFPSRKTTRSTVKQYIITGQEVLEENSWAGRYIPIVPVIGEELNIEGETYYRGMVTDMIDTQRQYNYWRTASTERVALYAKAPYIGFRGQFKSTKWRNANTKNYPYLEVEIMEDYPNLSLPQRERPPDISTGIANEIQTCSQEFGAVSGIYEPSLGQESNERSGRALIQRQRAGDMATYHFVDNLARALTHAGRILVDLIPKIYDTSRIVYILHPGGEDEQIRVNEPYTDQNGKERMYDLKTGKYDVVVDIGPSFATQRQEASEAMLEMLKAFPEAAPIIGDLVAKNFDWPESDEVAKRLKTMLPPEILAGDNPQLQAILQRSEAEKGQLTQALQYMQQQINEKDLQLKSKDGELQLKAAELQRKYQEMMQDYMRDMTELELEYTSNVPGSAV